MDGMLVNLHSGEKVLDFESVKSNVELNRQTENSQKNLRVVALSNGIHVFESDGVSTITNCIQRDVTLDVFASVLTFMRMKKSDKVEFETDGKKYILKLEEIE